MERLKNKITFGLFITFLMTFFVGAQIFADPIEVNKTALAREINKQYTNASRDVMKLEEIDYTTDSWGNYLGAIGVALNTEESDVATQGEVDSATGALTSARSVLVFEGQEDLNTLKVTEALLTPEDYVDYSGVTTALGLPESTNLEVRNKTLELYNAIEDLVTLVSVLNDVKLEEVLLIEEDYADYTAVTAALAMPETSNAEIVAKIAALNNAIDGLVFAAQEDLDAIKAAEALLVPSDYVGYTAVTSALTMPETTNAEVLGKANSISNALENLVFAGKADLDAAKMAASQTPKVSEDYTVASWTAFANAIVMPETTNSEMVAKTTAINNAVAGLVFAGQADLDAAKAEEATLTSIEFADYTAVTAALAMPETTNEEVIAKTAAIGNAIAVLELALQDELDVAKAAEALLVAADYADYTAVTAVLAMPETTRALRESKILAINDAIGALVFAGQADLNIAKADEALLVISDYADYTAVTAALAMPETTNAQVVAKTAAINNSITALVFAGKADLDTAKAAETLLVSSDYVDYTAVTAALAMPETTNTEVVSKTTAINNAIDGLVFAGKSDLDEVKATVIVMLKEVNYTTASWSAITVAMAMPETTNTEIVAKTTAIDDAIDGLIIYQNLTPLTSKINAQYSDKSRRTTLTLNSSDYTLDSWENYISIISLSKSCEYNENSLQIAIIEMVDNINNAVAGLIFAGKANLDTAKTAEGLLTAVDYANYSAVTAALAMSETTNIQVVAKTTAINNAIAALTFAGKVNYDEAMAEIETLIAEDYTIESFAEVIEAKYLNDRTNSNVVIKTTEINTAIAGLIKVSVKTAYEKAMAAIEALIEKDYTIESFAEVIEAKYLNDRTNSNIIIKTTEINTAIAELINVSAQTAYEKAMAKIETLIEKNYTIESFAKVIEAKYLNDRTNANVIIKTKAINDAIAGLISSKATSNYKVTSATGLNCRSLASSTSTKVTLYKFGTILNILEINNGWGRTTAGWVIMDYLQKV